MITALLLINKTRQKKSIPRPNAVHSSMLFDIILQLQDPSRMNCRSAFYMRQILQQEGGVFNT